MSTSERTDWDGACRDNAQMWDYHGEDGETWREQQVRHLIVARICQTCPEIIPCTEDLAARTEPVLGVIAGQVFSGNGTAWPLRRGRKAS